jgi:hypothetical protein
MEQFKIKRTFGGWIFKKPSDFGALAQLGEHLLCKQGVIGSIPIRSTKIRGMGLLGVVTELAPRKPDRFEFDILHQETRSARIVDVREECAFDPAKILYMDM